MTVKAISCCCIKIIQIILQNERNELHKNEMDGEPMVIQGVKDQKISETNIAFSCFVDNVIHWDSAFSFRNGLINFFEAKKMGIRKKVN